MSLLLQSQSTHPDVVESVDAQPPASGIPAAARILAEVYPQIVEFDATGMTAEEVHYFLGESAGVAYFQYQVLIRRP
jgi:hypothetical protein